MRNRTSLFLWLGLSIALTCSFSSASILEVFAKGSYSKNYSSTEAYTVSISATGGLAIKLISQIRLEGRYTNISQLQNQYTISGQGTVTDHKVQSDIFSAGLDIDFLGPGHSFQPFLFVGAGYVKTKQSYTFTPDGSSTSTSGTLPIQQGITANLGAGFRLMLASSFAFEIEVFAFSKNFSETNPLINFYGTAGVRIFI